MSHKFTRRVTLIAAIFAATLAFSSLGGNNAMSDFTFFHQGRAWQGRLQKYEKGGKSGKGPGLSCNNQDVS